VKLGKDNKDPDIQIAYKGKSPYPEGRFERMVQVWVDIHKEELLANWELAVSGEEPFRIDPLK